MNVLINERPEHIPLRAACRALGINRSSVYAKARCTKGGRSRKNELCSKLVYGGLNKAAHPAEIDGVEDTENSSGVMCHVSPVG